VRKSAHRGVGGSLGEVEDLGPGSFMDIDFGEAVDGLDRTGLADGDGGLVALSVGGLGCGVTWDDLARIERLCAPYWRTTMTAVVGRNYVSFALARYSTSLHARVRE
jgi:hypothetical protein